MGRVYRETVVTILQSEKLKQKAIRDFKNAIDIADVGKDRTVKIRIKPVNVGVE